MTRAQYVAFLVLLGAVAAAAAGGIGWCIHALARG